MHRLSLIHILRRLHLHRVMQDWEPDHLCWYNKPVYEEQILDTYQYYANDVKVLNFGITDLVKDWYENGKNFGLLLKTGHETKAVSYTHLQENVPVTFYKISGDTRKLDLLNFPKIRIG